jgi:chromosome segregation ATPase
MAAQNPFTQNQPVPEKKEFLRREEIVTMQKEISKLQEGEAYKEKEKILGIKPEQKQHSAVPLSAPPKVTPAPPQSAAAISPKNPSPAWPTVRTAAPLPKPATVENEKSQEQEKLEIEEEAKKILAEKQPLEQRKNLLLGEIKKLKLSLAPLLIKEEAAENEKKEIESRETSATIAEKKREFESQRWEAEKQIQTIEKEKWALEESIENIENEIAQIDSKNVLLSEKEREIKTRKENIAKKEGQAGLREQYFETEKAMTANSAAKKSLDEKIKDSTSQKNLAFKKLEKISQEEKAVEGEIAQISEHERGALDSKERRQLEMSRWELEKTRTALEKSRWDAENENSSLDAQSKNLQEKYLQISTEEERLTKKLGEIESQIGIPDNKIERPFQTPPSPRKAEPEEPTWQKQEPLQPKPVPAASIKELESSPEQENYSVPQSPITKLEEMRKREDAARERFLSRLEQIEKGGQPLPPQAQAKENFEPKMALPQNQKAHRAKKIIARVLIVTAASSLFLSLSSFAYYFFFVKK